MVECLVTLAHHFTDQLWLGLLLTDATCVRVIALQPHVFLLFVKDSDSVENTGYILEISWFEVWLFILRYQFLIGILVGFSDPILCATLEG